MKTKYSKPVSPEKFKGKGFDAMHAVVEIAKRSALYFKKEKKEKVEECLVCGSNFNDKILTAFEIEFVQCKNCTHVFQKNQFSDKSVYKFFETDKEINCHLPEDQFQYRCENINKPKIDEVMQLRVEMGCSNNDGQWLDIGCGAGDLLFQLNKDYHWNGVGIDISAPGIEMAKNNGINAILTDLFDYYSSTNNQDKITKSYDIISAMGYFDLVQEPTKHLKVVKRLLKDKGLLMLDHPKFDSFTGDLIKSVPECAGRYFNALERSIFTDKSMKYFLETNGFEVLFDWKYGLDIYTFISIITLKLPQLAKSNIVEYINSKNNEFQSIIDNSGYNDVNFCIAKLK